MKKVLVSICIAAVLFAVPISVSAHCRQAVSTSQCQESSVCMVDGICNGSCTGTGSCANYSGCKSTCNGSATCVDHGSCYGGHSATSDSYRGSHHSGGHGRCR